MGVLPLFFVPPRHILHIWLNFLKNQFSIDNPGTLVIKYNIM